MGGGASGCASQRIRHLLTAGAGRVQTSNIPNMMETQATIHRLRLIFDDMLHVRAYIGGADGYVRRSACVSYATEIPRAVRVDVCGWSTRKTNGRAQGVVDAGACGDRRLPRARYITRTVLVRCSISVLADVFFAPVRQSNILT